MNSTATLAGSQQQSYRAVFKPPVALLTLERPAPTSLGNPGSLAETPLTDNRASAPCANKQTVPPGEIATLISHLQRAELFRGYQQAFETTTGLPLALRAAGSFQVPLHGSKRLNPFCALMARSNRSCAACLQVQQRVEEAATHQPQTLECFAGLNESAVPVRVGDTLVGYLQTGQVFLRPPTRQRFKIVLRQIGGPRTAAELLEIETAYFQTRVVAKSHYELVLSLLMIFAAHLALVSNQILLGAAMREPAAITRARAFIAKHQSEDIHLRDVAQAVNMSPFQFCKLFKKTTGLTLTHFLARQRIEVVKRLLLKAHVRVTEAAYAAGFQSLSQFNRVFQRVAGESPSDFRGRLRSQSLVFGSSDA